MKLFQLLFTALICFLAVSCSSLEKSVALAPAGEIPAGGATAPMATMKYRNFGGDFVLIDPQTGLIYAAKFGESLKHIMDYLGLATGTWGVVQATKATEATKRLANSNKTKVALGQQDVAKHGQKIIGETNGAIIGNNTAHGAIVPSTAMQPITNQ